MEKTTEEGSVWLNFHEQEVKTYGGRSQSSGDLWGQGLRTEVVSKGDFCSDEVFTI